MFFCRRHERIQPLMVMGEEEASADVGVGSERAALIDRVFEGLEAAERNRYREQTVFGDGRNGRHNIASSVQ